MDRTAFITDFWRDVLSQNEKALERYFSADAIVRWHNTNEQFTAQEYIVANCTYPGAWQGEIERLEHSENLSISVARVWSADKMASFHVTSFFEFSDDKIVVLNEYWGDDGTAPRWRLNKKIGTPIK